MLSIPKHLRIFLYAEATDMRKSFTGLIGIVTDELQLDPLDGALFLFRNRTGDRVKLLYWDGDGFAYWYKRLESGTFQMPLRNATNKHTVLTSSELLLILEGVDLGSVKQRKRYKKVS